MPIAIAAALGRAGTADIGTSMDLRRLNPSADQIGRAKSFAMRGLLTYQPFVFSESLETGVGYEFERNEYAGLVHFPDIDQSLLKSPELRRIILAPGHAEEFRAANSRLRRLYEHFVDEICGAVPPRGASFLDVGCNMGYFPISFSLRGAEWAGGCDRQDFAPVFALLNEIVGTRAKFLHRQYDPVRHEIENVSAVDVVTSLAVICHLSDPLFHLATLGRLTRKALLVWSITNNDEGLTMHYGEPRGDYEQDRFPICFDNKVCPSMRLLRRSFELMGFRTILDMPRPNAGLPQLSWHGYPFRGLLGIR